MVSDSGYSQSISGSMVSAKTFRLNDALEEIDHQLDRMSALVGNLEDKVASVSVPNPTSDTAVPTPAGDSPHTVQLYSFANRIRLHANRLESTLNSLDL